MYSVIVGNVGAVIRTEVKGLAEKAFSDYVQISKTNTGRIGGQTVCLMDDEGREHRSYDPERDNGPVIKEGYTLRILRLDGPSVEFQFKEESEEYFDELSEMLLKAEMVVQVNLYDHLGNQVWWNAGSEGGC